MKRKGIDFTLYLVTDRTLSRGRSILKIVKAAVRSGVTVVQLREKNVSTKIFAEEGLRIRDFLEKERIPLIINDRIDVALAIGADGVHLGQDDMPLKLARRILPDEFIIGVSVGSIEEAVKAEKGGADYLGLSPVYFSSTKKDAGEPLGLDEIIKIREEVSIPLVGIGGLNYKNSAEVIKAGITGIAVVSAIVAADDPGKAAASLKEIIQRAKNET